MNPTVPTRRQFFGVAAGAAALLRPGIAADKPADIRLGVATYSLRNFPRTQAIAMIKQLGMREVSIKEVHLLYKSTPEEMTAGRDEFDAAGLYIASGGVIYMDKGDEAAIKVYFDYAKACGMPMIIAGATPETLPIIEKLAKQYNIRIAVHNHGPEDKIFPNPQAALKLMRNMDPRIGVCMDVGHTVRTGVDLIDTIRAAGDRLLDIHVKDLRDLKDAKSQCPVGEGAMPIVPMFKELIKMRYRGLVALEYEIDAANPLPGMQKSFDYMRGVLTKLRG
jgi:sugar phosphate isomerase/epimerase